MNYHVYLGELELNKVTSVARSLERDISVFDSVGGGKFPVPQNKGLCSWAIKYELSDQADIKALDKMAKSKEPVRLIINSDDYKVSEQVLLKGHAEDQEYEDVWPTTITVIEYVKAGVKTATVPYVAREGKAPALPKTVVIGDGTGGTKTPFQLALEAEQAGMIADGKDLFLGGFVRDESGKILYNPAKIPDGTKVTIPLDEAAAALAEKSAKGVQETKDFFSGIANKAASYWDYLSTTPTNEVAKQWAKKTDESLRKSYEEVWNSSN